ncbi:kinase-like protein [Auriscalpium vulgare]|uniref:Kinase-like protein n=1 Tax=Auriscalpium vulgare TaxID=40419 RepID=A0ACB8RRN1_9AGAM|nr:kinase-like protein [Auriscalpium vulgare]
MNKIPSPPCVMQRSGMLIPCSPTGAPPLGSSIDRDSLQLASVIVYSPYRVVYRAVGPKPVNQPRLYAVKCILKPPGVAASASERRAQAQHLRGQRGAALHQLASVHAHVVTLHRIVEERGLSFLIMDHCPDGDLAHQIRQMQRYVGRDEVIKDVFLQILDAVAFCHSQGIYHRDLKLKKILCSSGGLRAFLTGFEHATDDLDVVWKLQGEKACSKGPHTSPERNRVIAAPSGPCYLQASDMWSLGIILVNLIIGRDPWPCAVSSDTLFRAYSRNPAHFLSTALPISKEANTILCSMLQVDWRDRIVSLDLGRALSSVTAFYADDAVFHQGVACWPREVYTADSDSSWEEEDADSSDGEEEKMQLVSGLASPPSSSVESFEEESLATPSSDRSTWRDVGSATSTLVDEHLPHELLDIVPNRRPESPLRSALYTFKENLSEKLPSEYSSPTPQTPPSEHSGACWTTQSASGMCHNTKKSIKSIKRKMGLLLVAPGARLPRKKL